MRILLWLLTVGLPALECLLRRGEPHDGIGWRISRFKFLRTSTFLKPQNREGTPPRQLQPKCDPECPLVAAQHRVKLRLPSELPAPQRGEPSRRAGWSARQRGSQSESGILCPLAPQLEGRGGEEGAAWGIMAARVLVLVAPLSSQLSAASTLCFLHPGQGDAWGAVGLSLLPSRRWGCATQC